MSDAPPVDVTIREITELVRLFEQTGWASLELDIHGMHLTLGKQGAPRQAAAAPAAAAAPLAPTPTLTATPGEAPPTAAEAPGEAPGEPDGTTETVTTVSTSPAARSASSIEVRSPVVGAFWVAPSPGEPPFVQVGDRVEVGQQIAIVEVMKLMSDVSAPTAGVVVEICATNADMVEYDQVLFVIDPDG